MKNMSDGILLDGQSDLHASAHGSGGSTIL